MPIKYNDRETTVLTAAQRTKFVTFVTGIWPGAAGDIEKAKLHRNQAGDLLFTVVGTLTVTDTADLPAPPFNVDVDGSNYTYRHEVSVTLNAAQTTAFVDFVTDTWTGVPADVEQVTFQRTGGGTDVQAEFNGTKTVATIGDLPDRELTVVEIT